MTSLRHSKCRIVIIGLVAVGAIVTQLFLTLHHQTAHDVTEPGVTVHDRDVSAVHTSIITTVFWVGEIADADNGGIPNAESAWDEQWQQHYGGVDAEQPRHGLLPARFTPRENPFYIALPYNDISETGSRKATAKACLKFSPLSQQNPHSWCKNSWLAITSKHRTAYAQWEDVGPFQEDDNEYVFGRSRPSNVQDTKAGLDVSPAVRDYLQLGDVSSTDWRFIRPENVPDGPWKTYITSSVGYTVD